jgi:hypothetical protein
VHTWLAWLVRVIWSAARRILGIPQAIDQAEYCLFVICRNSRLIEFLEHIAGSLSSECDCFVLPPVSGSWLAISEEICVSAATIHCRLD